MSKGFKIALFLLSLPFLGILLLFLLITYFMRDQVICTKQLNPNLAVKIVFEPAFEGGYASAYLQAKNGQWNRLMNVEYHNEYKYTCDTLPIELYDNGKTVLFPNGLGSQTSRTTYWEYSLDGGYTITYYKTIQQQVIGKLEEYVNGNSVTDDAKNFDRHSVDFSLEYRDNYIYTSLMTLSLYIPFPNQANVAEQAVAAVVLKMNPRDGIWQVDSFREL